MQGLPPDRLLEFAQRRTGYDGTDEQLVAEMLDEVYEAEILGTAKGRRKLGLASPEFWDSHYAKMREAPHRTKWLEKMDTMIKHRHTQRMLLLAPRDHGKTEAVITICARAVCFDRNIRILIICASENQAHKRLARVKAILRSDAVVEDFCQDPEAGFWGWNEEGDARWRDGMVLVTRTLDSVDPTIEAIGRGGKITGGHFDLIIADDIEDKASVMTAGERKKTRTWFSAELQPMLVRGGAMIVIGTKKHHDDLYAHLEDNPTFSLMKDPAILNLDEVKFELVYAQEGSKQKLQGVQVTQGEPRCLWRERPFEHLIMTREAMREDEGVLLWNREFQHVVQDDSTAAVEIAQLERAATRGKKLSLYEVPKRLTLKAIYQGWDFSLVESAAHAARKDTDYTVGLTWARTDEDHRVLLGIRRERGITQDQLMLLMEEEYDKFQALGLKPLAVAMERNNFGRLHYTRALQRGRLPAIPHDTTARSKADPWVGIPGLALLFEQDRVILPSRTRADRKAILPLQQELHGLGVERHDDTVMALHVAESVTRLQPNQADPIPKVGGLVREEQEPERRPSRRSRVRRRGPPQGATRFNSRTGWE